MASPVLIYMNWENIEISPQSMIIDPAGTSTNKAVVWARRILFTVQVYTYVFISA